MINVECTGPQPEPGEYLFQAVDPNGALYYPAAVVRVGAKVAVTVCNCGPSYKIVPKGDAIGTVQAIDKIVPTAVEALEPICRPRVNASQADQDFLARVNQYVAVLGKPDALAPPDVPSHIEAILEGVRDVLDPINLESFRQTLLDYQDIFSAHDTDLGRFNGITHSIDTGDAKPIKQRQRRTPLGFEGEESAHLQKMLEAGVLEPSHSEWA